MDNVNPSGELSVATASALSIFTVNPEEESRYDDNPDLMQTNEQIYEVRDEVVRVIGHKREKPDDTTECTIWSDDLALNYPQHPARERFNNLLIDLLSPSMVMEGQSETDHTSENYEWYQTKLPNIFITKTTHEVLKPRDPTEGKTVTWQMVNVADQQSLTKNYGAPHMNLKPAAKPTQLKKM